MSCTGIALGLVVVAAASLDLACALEAPRSRTEDAGPLFDGAAPLDANLRAEGPPDPVTGFTNCFNGVDEDQQGGLDCADSSCAITRQCCVGSRAAACCTGPGRTEVLDLSACGSDASGCGGLRVVEGNAQLATRDAAAGDSERVLALVGDAQDSIADLPNWTFVPATERVVLQATIDATPGSGIPLDARGFGLWDGAAEATRATPTVGALVSATRGDVSLVVGTRVVASAPIGTARTYVLSTEAGGAVSLELRDETGARVGSMSASLTWPSARLVPLLFGRLTNYGPQSTALRAFSASSTVCDVPTALVRDGVVRFESVALPFESDTVRDPSVLVVGDARTLVFAATVDNEPAIFAGQLVDAGVQAVRDVALLRLADARALDPTAQDLAGPHLARGAGETVDLYAAVQGGSGDWYIVVKRDVLGEAPMLERLELPGGSFDDPALLADGALLVREHLADGSTQFVRLQPSMLGSLVASRVCGTDTLTCEAAEMRPTIHANSGLITHFDRDEIRGPFALAHQGTERVFFAGRRGTRWSIGALRVGADGTYFQASEEPILEGVEGGAEALGVASPSAWVEAGQLHLVYMATDGVTWTLMQASQPIR